MSEQEIVTCIICNSGSIKSMISLPDHTKIMLCGNCKNAFTHPRPKLPDYTAEDFQANQAGIDRMTYLEELPVEIRESYSLQLRMVEKNLPGGASVLEIGGGEGIFLNTLKEKGYDVELIEPSISASVRARKRGLKVCNDYFQNYTFDRKYDLVCMGHVLEHMENPLQVIEKIKTLLTPQGFILLTQTDFRGFMPRFLKANWYAWVPAQHFTHFSVAGLKFLAKKTSMSISGYRHSRLVHGPSIYRDIIKYIPMLQDQIHILLQMK